MSSYNCTVLPSTKVVIESKEKSGIEFHTIGKSRHFPGIGLQGCSLLTPGLRNGFPILTYLTEVVSSHCQQIIVKLEQ